MKPLDVSTVAQFSQGHLSGHATHMVKRVITDSRRVQPGDLFVALKGDKFDAHDFLPQVMAAGASACLVENQRGIAADGCTMIEVADTLVGLQNLARGYRSLVLPQIIGLTGSNGKTSTKDLTAVVMSRLYATRATLGNLNNHIGVPLTLLAMEEDDECGVVEMGMNHAGEIKVLVDIALPDAAIVTNVGVAHIEHLGSQDAIAWEKGTLPANVHSDGVVVLNANDPYSTLISRHCQARVLTAGVETGDVQAFDLRARPEGTDFKLKFAGEVVETFLPIVGRHMVGNAALAACMGWAHEIPPDEIAEALRTAKLTGGRMEMKGHAGIQFIDDSYNANPDSMQAGLSALAAFKGEGRKVAVLGRMGELGAFTEQGHRSVGSHVASLGLDLLCTVGTDESGLISQAAKEGGLEEVHHFPAHTDCAAFLREWLKPGDTVLIKGSRSAGMEKVLTFFIES